MVTAFIAHAQKPTIRSSVSKNKLLLGESFTLTVEACIPAGSVVKPVRIDSIPHFEFAESPIIDTIKNAKEITIKGVYTLRSFDSGHWVIPSYSLSSSIRTDTLPIDIMFSEFDPNQDYHDIKDIIEVEEEQVKKKWWLYVAGGLILIALIILLLRKKKSPKAIIVQTSATAYEDAMNALAKLKASPPATKEYYSRLIDIFRLYVSEKKGIKSLQKTTDDLVVQIQSLNIPKDPFDRLAQSLRMADFVKFAKYIPVQEDDRIAFENIKQGVTEIEQLK
jgi:hypothetical protein